jgi:hypothetical protein
MLVAMPGAAEELGDASEQEPSSADVSACVADHEQARALRLEKRWFEARATMSRCASEVCPLSIRADCQAWAEEVTRALPTIVILIEREDRTPDPVHVTLDGSPLTLGDGAAPIEVLPGTHQLTFTLGQGQPVVRHLTLDEGEKNHIVRVRFTPPVAETPAARASVPLLPKAELEERPVPTSTYVLGGAALVSFAAATALLISGLTDLTNARDTCKPDCSSSERESIEARFLLADVSAGVGAILTGFAVYTFVDRPTVRDRVGSGTPSPPATGATGVVWGGRF